MYSQAFIRNFLFASLYSQAFIRKLVFQMFYPQIFIRNLVSVECNFRVSLRVKKRLALCISLHFFGLLSPAQKVFLILFISIYFRQANKNLPAH